MKVTDPRPVIVVGGGIGGLATALALANLGIRVKLLERAAELGEIGAGIQMGPNAFNALDSLGVGKIVRSRSVFVEKMIMMDSIDGTEVMSLALGEAFRKRFGNPYVVIHRADIHGSILEVVRQSPLIELQTGTEIVRFEQDEKGVVVFDSKGNEYRGQALVAADGNRSFIRDAVVGDERRVTGHVVYRGVVAVEDMPEDLRMNAPCLWAGPNNHIIHYPLRGGKQFNLVVTFHSREKETGDIREGSQEEVLSYFQELCERPRPLLSKPSSWRRWSTTDRNPVPNWTQSRVTLVGDAAHPAMQYLAQGACMALEDAVCMGEAIKIADGDLARGFQYYQAARIPRTARIVLSTREMGRLYHASGVERLVRNSLWTGRSDERFYDAVEWLYGWQPLDGLRHLLA